ncbi:MAG: dephospho-CoA kinase, partial [Clostridia bacterium]|nr:dephospho-CoA kinase [Clostridia bacterium]
LNAILHPVIRARLAAAVERAGETPVLIDAPQLFEGECDSLCTATVAVLATPALRRERICRRDGLTPEEAEQRMSVQPDDAFYLDRCDHILYNNADAASLAAATDRLITSLTEEPHE